MALTTTYSSDAVVTIYTALSPPNDSFALMMEVSFSEQFSNASNGNTECIRAVESFMDICFNKKLAIAAIEATATDNKQSNTRHILEIQKCISEKAGLTHLRDADLSLPMLQDLSNIAMRLLIIPETVT